MKKTGGVILAVLVFFLQSCKKDTATKEVEFKSASYLTLGTYDSSGKPNYLTNNDIISAALLTYIDSTLPDRQNLTVSHPELFLSPMHRPSLLRSTPSSPPLLMPLHVRHL